MDACSYSTLVIGGDLVHLGYIPTRMAVEYVRSLIIDGSELIDQSCALGDISSQGGDLRTTSSQCLEAFYLMFQELSTQRLVVSGYIGES